MNSNAAKESAEIAIQDLVVGFSGGPPVLERLSIRVAPGEIVALLGASGCGKSTLLRSVAGLIEPKSGKIEFSGPVRRWGDLSYVFQDATLLPWRTVQENVRLPFELGRSLDQPAREGVGQDRVVRSNLESVGLGQADWQRFPRELSGGMRMRTSLARALVTNPSILLLDEPFAALDDLLRTQMNELILDLWQKRRRTIVFVTHNIAEAVYLSHRVAVLGRGRIAEILENPLGWPRSARQRTCVEFAEFYGAISHSLAEAQ